MDISFDRLLVLVVSVLSIVALWAFVKFTETGRAIRATAENPEAAQTLGIKIKRIYSLAFGIGSAFAGLAGALLISMFPAYPTVGAQPGLKSFAVIILGGLGNVTGAIAGGVVLGILEAFSIFTLSSGWQNVIVAGLIIVVLIVRPSGLFATKGDRV